jgi:hypothetical protein
MVHPDQKQLTLYANLMEEVKVRFDVINHGALGRTGLAAPFVREFLYLQIRILCELIALGCLVAHGDMAILKSHKIGRSYSADEILDRMTSLRPHFYPTPMKEKSVKSIDGLRRLHDLEAVNPSPLPKEELLAIHGKTHKHLHRGSLKKLLSADTPLDLNINVPEIITQAQKMSDLLAHHLIAINEHQLIVCLLKNPMQNDRVQVVTAQRTELQLPIVPTERPACVK